MVSSKDFFPGCSENMQQPLETAHHPQTQGGAWTRETKNYEKSFSVQSDWKECNSIHLNPHKRENFANLWNWLRICCLRQATLRQYFLIRMCSATDFYLLQSHFLLFHLMRQEAHFCMLLFVTSWINQQAAPHSLSLTHSLTHSFPSQMGEGIRKVKWENLWVEIRMI